jgi:hypothetical protein
MTDGVDDIPAGIAGNSCNGGGYNYIAAGTVERVWEGIGGCGTRQVLYECLRLQSYVSPWDEQVRTELCVPRYRCGVSTAKFVLSARDAELLRVAFGEFL